MAADVEKLAKRVSDQFTDAMDSLTELVAAMAETHPTVHEDFAEQLEQDTQELHDKIEDMASAIADLHDDDETLYERLEGWGHI